MIDFILKYETEDITTEELIDGFAELIKSGTVWQLQGRYGRTAEFLINSGYIDNNGNILKYDNGI